MPNSPFVQTVNEWSRVQQAEEGRELTWLPLPIDLSQPALRLKEYRESSLPRLRKKNHKALERNFLVLVGLLVIFSPCR